MFTDPTLATNALTSPTIAYAPELGTKTSSTAGVLPSVLTHDGMRRFEGSSAQIADSESRGMLPTASENEFPEKVAGPLGTVSQQLVQRR